MREPWFNYYANTEEIPSIFRLGDGYEIENHDELVEALVAWHLEKHNRFEQKFTVIIGV